MATEVATKQDVVLRVNDLRTYFQTRWGTVKAVDGISFDLRRGETLGIVGESGSGKSVTMLSLMRLIPMPPGRIVSGSIELDGEDILRLSEAEMNKVRGSKIALIIQDPMTSLNPVFTIGNQVSEAIRIHQDIPKRSIMEQALSVLQKVNIPAAETRMRDYPHQMSGGMRQRVVGAIGISCQPEVLIADEPTTSLDVTIQGAVPGAAERTATGLQRRPHIHNARFRHRRQDVRPGGGDVRRAHRGAGQRTGHFQQPVPSLHGSAAGLGAQDGGGRGSPVLHRGPAADAARPAGRLPVCAPVPVRDGPLPRGIPRQIYDPRGPPSLMLAVELI